MSTKEDLLFIQNLALDSAKDTFSNLKEGMSEKDACYLMDSYLRKNGVEEYFHYPFAWFGERTKFQDFSRPLPLLNKKFDFKLPSFKNPLPHWGIEFLPTDRKLKKDEAVILDVAPIYNGHFADIGYANFFGESATYHKAQEFLLELRSIIPSIVEEKKIISEIYQEVSRIIESNDFINCHQLYPLGVLGHKVGKIPNLELPKFNLLGFGPKAYTFLLSKNLSAPFYYNKTTPYLCESVNKPISDGFWAIEPHLGFQEFGIKFEEVLVVDNGKATWLSDMRDTCQ